MPGSENGVDALEGIFKDVFWGVKKTYEKKVGKVFDGGF